MRLPLFAAAAALLSGCALGRPFRTEAPPAAGSTVVVAVTYARYRPEAADRFWVLTRGVLDRLPGRDGLLGHSVRRTLFGDEVWTMTAWISTAALTAFIRSPEHRTAMAATDETVAEARFARFTVPAADFPPGWDRALEALAAAPVQGYGPAPAR
jgi:heme-degrading monooxygenase HmoA